MKNHNDKVKSTKSLPKVFIALISVVIAAAIAATCLLLVGGAKETPVDGVTTEGEVYQSTTYSNPTNGTSYATSLRNGDVLNFAFKGTYYYVTLPKGTYTVQVWGAQGGGCGNNNGGKGGYATGTMTLTANTTVYVYVGGRGTNSTSSRDGNHDSTRYAGGWNGGGNGSGSKGPGGGGATDIRTGGSSLSNRIIVAAGGGGGESTTYTQAFSSSGSLGQGASGCSSRHSSSYSNDEGGGGGGYYGGAVRHGDDPYSSYCGSNYTGGVSGGSSSYGNNAAAGKATITAVNVNQNPVQKNPYYETPSALRGTTNINVTPGNIATDPEGTTMYFTNGTTSNLDALTTGQANLFLNQACTVSASSYLTWNITTTTLNIKSIIKYPRNGYDYCTQDGRLQVWTRVRDSFGSSTTRGYSVVSFYVKVTKPTRPTTVSTTLNANNGNDFDDVWVGMSKSGSTPTTSSLSNIYNPNAGTTSRYTAQIVRPLRLSGTVAQKSVTITAASLLAGISTTYDQAVISLLDVSRINKNDASRIFAVNEYDNSTNVVKAYTTAGAAIANTFSQITLYGVNSNANYQVLKCRLYLVEKSSARGAYYQIQDNSSNTQYFDIDIVFKVNNTRPTVKAGTAALIEVNQNDTAIKSLGDFFEDAENKTISASTHKITGVKVPEGEFLQVEKYGKVVSTASGVTTGTSYYNVLPNGSTMPTAAELKAATSSGELPKDKYPTGFDSSFISTGVTSNAYIQYSYSGASLTIKGLRATSSMYAKRTSSSKAVVSGGGGGMTYPTENEGIASANLGGTVANPGHFYILVHIQDLNDLDDAGIWLPVSIIVGSNAGPTSIQTERGEVVNTVMPTASGSAGSSFYFTPMGITVDRTLNPIGQYLNGAASASNLSAHDLKPIAADADNFLTANALNPSTNAAYTGKLNELITGVSSAADVQNSVSVNSGGKYFTVSEEYIYIPTSQFGGRVTASNSNVIVATPSDKTVSGYVAVRGYKITLKNWTHNRYMYATVQVRDSAGNPGSVKIAIFVDNKTPRAIESGADKDNTQVATINDTSNGATRTSSYDAATKVITYKVPMHDTIVITPYDLLYDDNMKNAGITYPTAGFTLNGLSGNFSASTGVFTANGNTNGDNPIRGIARSTSSGYNYTSDDYLKALKSTLNSLSPSSKITSTGANSSFIQQYNAFGATSAMSTYNDRLFFERTNDKANLDGYVFDPTAMGFVAPTIKNSTYVSTAFGSSLVLDRTYNIDFLVITAERRTPDNAYSEITLNVRDRTGSGATGAASGLATITIRVEVLNSNPTLKNPNTIHTLSVDPVIGTDNETVVTPSTLVLSAASLLMDNEEDTPIFDVNGSISVLDADGNGKDRGTTGNDYLDNYIRVSISSQTLTITALNSTQAVRYLDVCFYVVDDQGGTSTQIKMHVEVINSPLKVNLDTNTGFGEENGANDDFNLWTVNTQNNKSTYYFAAGQTAMNAHPNTQARSLVTDADALQGVVLAPTGVSTSNAATYQKAPSGTATADLWKYVPYIATAPSTESPVAAVIRFEYDNEGNTLNGMDNIASYDIEYYVDGTTYRASELRNEGAITEANKNKFFDNEGRWIVTDWAITVTTKGFFAVGSRLKLEVGMRDSAAYGGDTAGLDGYEGGVSKPVKGYKNVTYRLFVNDSTGIIPYDYYDAFDGYYTVADGHDASINYISTYYTTESITTEQKKSIYLTSDNEIVESYDTTAGTLLKDRSGSGVNGTAWENSGLVYNAENIAKLKDQGAFRYSHTIEVTADKTNNEYDYTYIPMSYFALSPSSVSVGDNGQLVYSDRYVAYDIPGVNGYIRGGSAVLDAITVTDGNTIYTGSADTSTTKSLATCPYVELTFFDVKDQAASDPNVNPAYDGAYFNNAVARTTVDSNNKRLEGVQNFAGENSLRTNALIGNGHAMYLVDQEKYLQEHLFGIGIRKTSSRAGVNNLTMTINVALCQSNGNLTKVAYTDETKSKNTAKVTFNLKLANEKMDLVPSTSLLGNATDGYYTNVSIENGSGAYTIGLIDNKDTATDPNAYNTVINYTDPDTYDVACFYPDSALKLSAWSGNMLYARTLEQSQNVFTYTASSAAAQASLSNYYNGYTSDIGENFQPNPGMYGTNNGTADGNNTPNADGNEGYSKYFSATVDSNGSRLTIYPLATTVLNTSKFLSNPSRQQLEDFYSARGLKAQFDDRDRFVSAYYPYKILIYDTCGDGFTEASYVAVEVRITVKSAPLTLGGSMVGEPDKSGNNTLDISLPVGSRYTFSLKNIISDYELLSGSSGWYYQTEYDALDPTKVDDKFKLETGAYLVTPFGSNNIAESTSAGKDIVNTELHRATTGTNRFTDINSDTEYQGDVIMSMNLRPGESLSKTAVPRDNNITIRVNRRTVYKDSNQKIVYQNNFVFTLKFSDSNNQSTGTLRINVTVLNQNPTRRSSTLAPTSVTMRVGDSFALVTTPYDSFADLTSTDSNGNPTSSDAYIDSYTRSIFTAGKTGIPHVLSEKDGNGKYFYENLTSDNVAPGGAYAIREPNTENANAQQLGYIAVADDDMPWGLRITDVTGGGGYFYTSAIDTVATEQTNEYSYGLGYSIEANRACNNVPLTATIIDGDGGTTTFTVYVTVTSSRPVAITSSEDANKHKLADGLIQNGSTSFNGQYKLYMIADSGVYSDADFDKTSVALNDGTTVDAYGHITLDVRADAGATSRGGLAYDPDTSDNQSIGLFIPTEQDSSVFELNGVGLESLGNNTYSDVDRRFTIVTNSNSTSFKITCNSYNPDSDKDLLKFYIRDNGNNISANATPVTITITTLYSAIKNEYQASKVSGQGSNMTITSAENVHVKPYDAYVGNGLYAGDDSVGAPSTYQFLHYAGMPDSVDQIEGESGAHITDPDVAANAAALSYGVRVYAFIDQVTDDDGKTEFKSKSLDSTFTSLFNITTDGYFYLKNTNSEEISKYLIGGRDIYGQSYEATVSNNRALVSFVQSYFTFALGEDGVSLELRPVTANLNVRLLLYVEATKTTGTRAVRPSDSTPVSAGSLFYVSVEDSAPVANSADSEVARDAMSFTGKVGAQKTFTIFDNDYPESSMFTDSDMGDNVTVDGFLASDRTDASYTAALAGNECEDWKAGNNKVRAITVAVDNDAHTLTVTINRRVDLLDEDGKYLPAVTLELNITGKDRKGTTAVTTLYITIENSDFTLIESGDNSALGSYYPDNAKGVGYTLMSGGNGYEYELDVSVSKDLPALEFRNVFIDGSWIADPDYDRADSGVESFHLVEPLETDPDRDKYLTNDGVDVMNGDIKIATIMPLFRNNDRMQLSGFTVTAQSYYRGYTGTAYIRILDRAGDENNIESGVTLTVNVTLLNSAPFIKDGKDTAEHFIVGTAVAGAELAPIDIDISEFVDDPNPTDKAEMLDDQHPTNTYLRIVSTITYAPDEIYGTGIDNSNDVFTVRINENDPRKCTIVPKVGFFGSQIVEIMVSDGNYTEVMDALSVSFQVKVTVVYNFAEVTSLKSVTAVRGLTKVIDVDTVVADIDNTASGEAKSAPRRLAGSGVSQSTDSVGTFNPGAKYAVTRLSAPPAYAQYVEIGQNDEGQWQFRALRVTSNGDITLNVEFKLASEVDNANATTYTQSFIVSIVDNPKPEFSADFADKYYQFNTTQTGSNKYVLNTDGSIQLTPKDLFTDNDGDVMRFVDVKSSAPTLVSVEIKSDDSLVITFHAKGEAVITVSVADLTGESKAFALNVQNLDLETPNLWMRVVISFETNMILWIAILAAVALLIIILIIVIVAVKRKKRKREEIEALLISEMELEEQMMRLAAPGNMPYNSYGYLPPTMPAQNDPGLMLGSQQAPQNPNVLNLNPGTDANHGVPPDSDM